MYRWLSLGVVAAALLLVAFWVSKGGGSGGQGRARASVEEHDGILVVRVEGPPRAKGRALGEALAPRIRAEITRALPEDPGLRDFAVATCGAQLGRFLPEACREEIRGIAEGAGIPFDEALFLNTRFEIAAHGLAGGEHDLPLEGAVGPGPSAGCLLATAADLVVVIHEDRDPPLVLVGRPGMAGGFLGTRGNVAAAMRPIRADAPPTLKGLVWTLHLRRLLEEPQAAPAEMTGPLSVAMVLPDGATGTLNLAVFGASWYPAGGNASLTTDEAALPREAGRPKRVERDAAERARISGEAARLLAGPPPASRTLLVLTGEALTVHGPSGRVSVPLRRPRTPSRAASRRPG